MHSLVVLLVNKEGVSKMQLFLTCWSPSLFWSVLALFYLGLAIVTLVMGRPVLKGLSVLGEDGDTLVSYSPGTGKVGLESLLHRAFKAIIITDIIGFILAAIAAGISVTSQLMCCRFPL